MIEPAEVMRRKNQAFNAQDSGETMRHFSPAVTMATPIGALSGREQVGQFFAAFWEAFPDLWLTVEDEISHGDKVALRLRCKGTHLGTLRTPGGEIPATGRQLDLTMSDHLQVTDGEIVAVHLYFDQMTLLVQLGAMPVASTT